jgi:hypothetical protein
MNWERLNHLKERDVINWTPECAPTVPRRRIPLFIKGYMVEQHRIQVQTFMRGSKCNLHYCVKNGTCPFLVVRLLSRIEITTLIDTRRSVINIVTGDVSRYSN